MSVLVTVGTTKFDSLVKEADKVEFHDQLIDCGYTKLYIQYGSGGYVPAGKVTRHSKNLGHKKELEINAVPYIKEISYSEYDLIIGHAGAGTILNSLRNNKKMIVVINNSLMDNHQSELATQLHDEKYLIAIDDPQDLTSSVSFQNSKRVIVRKNVE
ncbi:UDP-N-acetylglucosamine transferase subunit ALG13 [Cryptosporidium felis]|nr:UDP-N-acetylglucosamine transferase subunit ALG13 [Cryptosporidium felis]